MAAQLQDDMLRKHAMVQGRPHMTIYGYNTWSYDHIWVCRMVLSRRGAGVCRAGHRGGSKVCRTLGGLVAAARQRDGSHSLSRAITFLGFMGVVSSVMRGLSRAITFLGCSSRRSCQVRMVLSLLSPARCRGCGDAVNWRAGQALLASFDVFCSKGGCEAIALSKGGEEAIPVCRKFHFRSSS